MKIIAILNTYITYKAIAILLAILVLYVLACIIVGVGLDLPDDDIM